MITRFFSFEGQLDTGPAELRAERDEQAPAAAEQHRQRHGDARRHVGYGRFRCYRCYYYRSCCCCRYRCCCLCDDGDARTFAQRIEVKPRSIILLTLLGTTNQRLTVQITGQQGVAGEESDQDAGDGERSAGRAYDRRSADAGGVAVRGERLELLDQHAHRAEQRDGGR